MAQLYVSRREGQVFRPLRELKGFVKVRLEPGESRTVFILLDDKAFRYFNVKTGRWEVEGGAYEVQVGASSQDIRLTGTVQLEGSTAPLPYDLDGLPSYADGQITEVSDREFSTLLGRPLPEARWNRAAPLELNDTFTQLSYAHGWVAA